MISTYKDDYANEFLPEILCCRDILRCLLQILSYLRPDCDQVIRGQNTFQRLKYQILVENPLCSIRDRLAIQVMESGYFERVGSLSKLEYPFCFHGNKDAVFRRMGHAGKGIYFAQE